VVQICLTKFILCRVYWLNLFLCLIVGRDVDFGLFQIRCSVKLRILPPMFKLWKSSYAYAFLMHLHLRCSLFFTFCVLCSLWLNVSAQWFNQFKASGLWDCIVWNYVCHFPAVTWICRSVKTKQFWQIVTLRCLMFFEARCRSLNWWCRVWMIWQCGYWHWCLLNSADIFW